MTAPAPPVDRGPSSQHTMTESMSADDVTACTIYTVPIRLKHLSPKLSPTSRNTTLLAATWRYGDRVPSISQLAEKVRDASDEVEN